MKPHYIPIVLSTKDPVGLDILQTYSKYPYNLCLYLIYTGSWSQNLVTLYPAIVYEFIHIRATWKLKLCMLESQRSKHDSFKLKRDRMLHQYWVLPDHVGPVNLVYRGSMVEPIKRLLLEQGRSYIWLVKYEKEIKSWFSDRVYPKRENFDKKTNS